MYLKKKQKLNIFNSEIVTGDVQKHISSADCIINIQSNAIFDASRVSFDDPIAAWNEHNKILRFNRNFQIFRSFGNVIKRGLKFFSFSNTKKEVTELIISTTSSKITYKKKIDIDEGDSSNMTGETKIYSQNLSGLEVDCFIHFEEIGHSTEYYNGGSKHRVTSICEDGTFIIEGTICSIQS